jgi:hypothetical protein
MATILALVKDAADELSLARPTSVIDNTTDDTAVKMLRHLTRTCRQLATRYDWQRLRREKTFTTVAAADQNAANPIPTDFLRFVPDSFYNRTKRYRVIGPLTAEEWQGHQAALATRVYDAYTMRGGRVLIAPTPAADQSMAYEYITKYIGTDTTEATDRLSFTVDTDLPFMDDELLVLGMVWRYRKSEGQDYAEEFREYEMRLNDLYKMDGGRRLLDMAGSNSDRVPVSPRVPDTLIFP